MKILGYLFFLVYLSMFLFYSCADEGSSIPNNGNGTTNNAPDMPSDPHPPDSAIDVPRSNVLLSWTCSDPDPSDTVRYDLYISMANPPDIMIAGGLLNPAYGLGVLDPNRTFYWKVVAKDNHGAVRNGNTWRFTTGN
jgi:hypothetical protein